MYVFVTGVVLAGVGVDAVVDVGVFVAVIVSGVLLCLFRLCCCYFVAALVADSLRVVSVCL